MSLLTLASDDTELEEAAELSLDKFNESIKSGESKFKLFCFQPSYKNEDETAKCVDFWKFIEGSELRPAGALDMSQKVSTVNEESEHEEEIGWKYAYKILKIHKLDVLAKATTNDMVCELCKADKNEEDFEDHFCMKSLNSFDPQRKYYVEAEVQTDPIETAEVGTMTDFIDPAVLEAEALRLACEGIDDLMSQMAEMYRRLQEDATDCNCDVCMCNYTKTGKETECRYKEKCTCSCGETTCLCTQLSNLLLTNELASCDCKIRNQSGINIKLLVQKKTDLISRCHCSCDDLHCPCPAILDFYEELDRILFGGSHCTCTDPAVCRGDYPYEEQCHDDSPSPSCECTMEGYDKTECMCTEKMIKEELEIISCSSFISEDSELIESMELDESVQSVVENVVDNLVENMIDNVADDVDED